LNQSSKTSLQPRKMPVQERSTATFDAICEGTIQVLLKGGFERLTTTRVADRAGVSVGTLYQYFPNKKALLAAVTGRYLDSIVTEVEAACASHHNHTVREMVTSMCNAFIAAKVRRLEASQALYRPTAELGCELFVQSASERAQLAVANMLATAVDASFKDLRMVAMVMVSALISPMQAVVDAGATKPMLKALRYHAIELCVGYLDRVKI
jgi:AcrR family transcriptional regulator